MYGNQFLLDGGANTVPVHNEIGVVPMVDAVEEFKVETNSLKAEFGQTSGGVINVVTKSGTNSLHGSLYEFVRNDSMDARNAFATQPDNSGRIKPVLRYNQYGGTVGGPVYIPKLYNGKNKTFFFAGYEQWRFRNSELRFASVPTALQRNGDFSNTRDANGNLFPIYDPNTTPRQPERLRLRARSHAGKRRSTQSNGPAQPEGDGFHSDPQRDADQRVHQPEQLLLAGGTALQPGCHQHPHRPPLQ